METMCFQDRAASTGALLKAPVWAPVIAAVGAIGATFAPSVQPAALTAQFLARAPSVGTIATKELIRAKRGTVAVGSDDQNSLSGLMARLIALEATFYEDEGRPLSATSKQSLMRWLRLNPSFGRPLLTAQDDGKIIGTWINERTGSRLVVRFVSLEKCEYSVKLVGANPERTWGSCPPTELLARAPQSIGVFS